MDSKQIRQQMKAQLGYNARQVTVKQSCYGVTFTIRDASVDFEAVKTFSKTFEHIDYDAHTGCILRGGNTFVQVKFSEEVKDAFKKAWLPALEEAAAQISGTRLIKIPGSAFCLGGDKDRSDCYSLWGDHRHILTVCGLSGMAVEIGKRTMGAAKKVEEEQEPQEAEATEEPAETEEAEELNSYELRQEERRERFEALADKNAARSDRFYSEARRIGKVIPFGQPILVGHHSEGRARRDAARIGANMGKSVEASKKADYYRQKAESVGNGGISADDPAAVSKLREKLTGLEKAQATMKAINKAWRAAGKPEAENLEAWNRIAEDPEVKSYGFAYVEEVRKRLTKPWFIGRIPFPAYSLSNNNANIRRVEKRIKELEARRNAVPKEEIEGEIDGHAYTLRENVELNRLQIIFDGKPAPGIRQNLKRLGFRWSPRNKAWQRQLNQASRNAAASLLRAV